MYNLFQSMSSTAWFTSKMNQNDFTAPTWELLDQDEEHTGLDRCQFAVVKGSWRRGGIQLTLSWGYLQLARAGPPTGQSGRPWSLPTGGSDWRCRGRGQEPPWGLHRGSKESQVQNTSGLGLWQTCGAGTKGDRAMCSWMSRHSSWKIGWGHRLGDPAPRPPLAWLPLLGQRGPAFSWCKHQDLLEHRLRPPAPRHHACASFCTPGIRESFRQNPLFQLWPILSKML